MTDGTVNDFDRAREKMAGDFMTMIADSEELLKAAATVSDKGFALARTKFEDRLSRARATLSEAAQPALDKTRKTAAVADEYVRGNPWAAVGIAAAAGMLLGVLAAKR